MPGQSSSNLQKRRRGTGSGGSGGGGGSTPPPPPPPPPSGFTLTATATVDNTANTATLTWTVTGDASTITGWTVGRSAGGTQPSWEGGTQLAATVRTQTFTQLQDGATYTIYADAMAGSVRSQRISKSVSLTGTAPPPPPPPPPPPAGTGDYRPISARFMVENTGVCAHANFQSQVYRWRTEYYNLLNEGNFKIARFGFDPNNAGAKDGIVEAKRIGAKVLLIAVEEGGATPTSQTVQETTTICNWIKANVDPTVLWGVEGLNEPNHNRAAGAPLQSAGWETVTLNHQKAIWNALNDWTAWRDAGGKVVSASLHDDQGRKNNGADFTTFANTGVADYFDILGLHGYQGGWRWDNKFDARMSIVDRDFGSDMPRVFTECGYHNALETTAGHFPTPQDVCADYMPASILMWNKLYPNSWGSIFYEFLDDGDAGEKDIHENNFGLIEVGLGMTLNAGETADQFKARVAAANPGLGTTSATWKRKEQYTSLKAFLNFFDDPSGSYDPVNISISVTEAVADIEWCVVQKGSTTRTNYLVAWRDVNIWDAKNRVYLTAPAASSLTYVYNGGTRKTMSNITSAPRWIELT